MIVLIYIRVYYIDTSVELTGKFIPKYIREPSGAFSISQLVRISMASFPAFSRLLCKQTVCLDDKKKITQWPEDINFVSSY